MRSYFSRKFKVLISASIKLISNPTSEALIFAWASIEGV